MLSTQGGQEKKFLTIAMKSFFIPHFIWSSGWAVIAHPGRHWLVYTKSEGGNYFYILPLSLVCNEGICLLSTCPEICRLFFSDSVILCFIHLLHFKIKNPVMDGFVNVYIATYFFCYIGIRKVEITTLGQVK